MSEPNFVDFKCSYCEETVSFPETSVDSAQSCPICLQSIVLSGNGDGIGGKLPLPIKTRRLVLRRLEAGDWKDLLEFMSDDELFRYLDWYPLDEDGVLHCIESDRATQLTQTGGSLTLGIETIAPAKIIGWVYIAYRDDTHQQARISALINPRFHRQGYGTEAVAALLNFGFKGIHLHRIVGTADNRNTAGCGLLQKAGLRREGEFLQDRFLNGEWVNTVHYGLLRDEYQGG